jgi:hypothetical protein
LTWHNISERLESSVTALWEPQLTKLW